MAVIEDFWPRVLGGVMWLIFTLAGALLVLMQVGMVVGVGWGLLMIIL